METFKRIMEGPIFLVAGVIFAVIVQEYLEAQSIKWENGLIFTFAVLLTFVTFYISRGNAILVKELNRNLETFNKKLGSNNSEIEAMVEHIDQRIDKTMKTIGTSFEYVNDRWVNGELREGTVFKRVLEIVGRAKEEILISGYSDKKFDSSLLRVQNESSIEKANRTWRLEYLASIEGLLERENESSRPFKYYRIIQMPSVSEILSEAMIGKVEFDHCAKVLEIKERTRNNLIKIMTMQTERISTFVIVDRTHLILSDIGTRMTAEGEGDYLAGVFIIEDSTGSVVEGFRNYFMEELYAGARPIEKKDLRISGSSINL